MIECLLQAFQSSFYDMSIPIMLTMMILTWNVPRFSSLNQTEYVSNFDRLQLENNHLQPQSENDQPFYLFIYLVQTVKRKEGLDNDIGDHYSPFNFTF